MELAPIDGQLLELSLLCWTGKHPTYQPLRAIKCSWLSLEPCMGSNYVNFQHFAKFKKYWYNLFLGCQSAGVWSHPPWHSRPSLRWCGSAVCHVHLPGRGWGDWQCGLWSDHWQILQRFIHHSLHHYYLLHGKWVIVNVIATSPAHSCFLYVTLKSGTGLGTRLVIISKVLRFHKISHGI